MAKEIDRFVLSSRSFYVTVSEINHSICKLILDI
jgi:hypothetical protein